MYSLLVGSTSQNTYISCEHRSGIQGIATELGRINGRNYPTRKDIELKF